MKFLFAVLIAFPFSLLATDSQCYGTTSNGRLSAGVQLPSNGRNFESYSLVARYAGRTYVHSTVRDIIVNAYKSLEVGQPAKVYKYAETGFEEGGQFKPHKTHRNGLSVDFMTPVVDEKGRSVHLPTNPTNKFGYKIEFDKHDKYKKLSIDYEALAAHIVELHKESIRQGYDLWRVIFDPKLQPNLFKTKYASYIKNNIKLSTKKSWVRHDEHYHVDFAIPCKSL